ncbi:hypothetical protein FSP39_020562 [Pinctada imbricata]|uniref:Uncharacterized protein n=1 Tax=Pinctada imbricata TaxID=66713 RepID=A0AA88YG15_PINIB|nr:hypothetical protein FSP39_020562 [Pinctada imbricata]
MVIGLLDSDVPSSISISKVLPRNFTTLNTYHPYVYLPVLSTDFEEKALVDDFAYMRDTMMALRRPHSQLRLPYYETKIVGDSGNPSFFSHRQSACFPFCIHLWWIGIWYVCPVPP